MSNHLSWKRYTLPLLLAAAVAGCGEPDSIKTTEVARTGPPPRPADVANARGELDHMLTAIVPQGDQAWFFKLVARGDQIESLRKPFEEFVASVDASAGQERPSWTLPAGWEEKPGDALRAATIDVPAGDQNLPLTVSALPLAGEWDEYVERNVNRWMDQLQQPPLPAEKISELARKAPVKSGGEATIIELVGAMDRTASAGMGAMPPGHPPVDGTDATGTPPAAAAAGPPSTASVPGAEAAAESAPAQGAEFPKPKEFTYDPPAGWQPGRYGGMRTAAFNVIEDGKTAEVTVMPFPPVAQMTDPKAQADRWAGEVGLQLSGGDYDRVMTGVMIDGVEGQRFELLGPGDDKPLGTLAAMVQRGEKVWFFKMKGDRALIEREREAFDKFLASIKFTD